MKETLNDCSEQNFLGHIAQNARQLMWFLGAGTSRTAGMPTATDIIWDLKRQYYCLQENQDLQNHDINNKAIRRKIQDYLDSKGFPYLGSPEEYSFYFDLIFGQDYVLQQKYIFRQFDPQKISLNIGHRILAALLKMELARVVFTTNFDEVLETAFSVVAGRCLPVFHLEGTYAALGALNAEQFPIYAKIHGDFRYKSIKNLSSDLISNDKEIQKAFIAASNRYGLIISGYSGRDANVIAMYNEALEGCNPFPAGLFWTVPRLNDLSESVSDLIRSARKKGVRAHIIETGTFDIMLSKIWRNLSEKPEDLSLKIFTAKVQPVAIPLPPPGNRYPILRTNALPIIKCPLQCAKVIYDAPINFKEINAKIRERQPNIILGYTDPTLFWGNPTEIYKIFDSQRVKGIEEYFFEDPVTSIQQSKNIFSFFEEALVKSVCHDKPLVLRRKNRTYYAVINQEDCNNLLLQPLRAAVGSQGSSGDITGRVPGQPTSFWAEALSLKLEEKNGLLWLLLRPDIWITPLAQRENATDFLRDKKLRRYNRQSYQLLKDWITILFGTYGNEREVSVSCLPNTEYTPTFKISTRAAFSQAGG